VIGATIKGALLAVAAVAAVLIAPGCGDDAGETEAAGPSKEEYTARANQICVESRQEAEAVFEQEGFSGRPTAVEAQRALQGLVPVMRRSFGGRAALEAPEGDEETIDAIDAAGKEALAEFERISEDRAASLALMTGRTPDPATEADRLSGEYGIAECAGKD
jgi:hypothetical protein